LAAKTTGAPIGANVSASQSCAPVDAPASLEPVPATMSLVVTRARPPRTNSTPTPDAPGITNVRDRFQSPTDHSVTTLDANWSLFTAMIRPSGESATWPTLLSRGDTHTRAPDCTSNNWP